MFKRILVLNTEVSGMNKFLFRSLKNEGWELEICDIPIFSLPWYTKGWLYLSSFDFNYNRWKKKFDGKLSPYFKSAASFDKYTAYCEQLLREKWRPGDVILEIAGFFAPAAKIENLPGPYSVFLSFTAKLSEKEFPPWDPFTSSTERQAWYARETYLYQNAHLILTTNAHAKQSLVEDYQVKETAVSVIGYGVNLEAVSKSQTPHSSNKILFIGYDFERKGGQTLLAAFDLVKQALPEAELIIVGPLPPPQVPAGVNWLGPVKDRATIASLLQEAALFVMPSICEPFGLVFLEAMANGLPCIGAWRDAMPEIIQDGETGYLIEPGDVADLATKIKNILADEQLRQAMSIAAAKRVKEHFTWELVGKRITAAYKQLEEKTAL